MAIPRDSRPRVLDDPYGPFPDKDVLTEECKSVPTKVLELEDLMLECGGEPTGLTYCELDQPEYDRARVNERRVRFRGVLEIQSLTWLTEKACKVLQKQIHLRLVEWCLSNGRNHPAHPIPLKRIYADGHTIKVQIQGFKHMSAGFLTASEVRDGLRIHSRDRSYNRLRFYAVKSMHITTYLRSRKYFGRWRTLHVLEQVIGIDSQIRSPYGDKTIPLSERTPEWFVNQYLEHMAQAPEARKRRIAYDSSDSDIETETEGKMKGGRERNLRHVSRAEIRSLLATHARWVLEHQQERLRKWLDVKVWQNWVYESDLARKAAAREGIRWGKMIRYGSEADSDSDSDSDGMDDNGVPAIPVPRRVNRPQRSRPTRQNARPSASNARGALFVPSSSDEREAPPVDQSVSRSYDVDFSPPSSSPASPSSSVPSRSATPPNPEIISLIPPALLHRPALPRADFTWSCPARDCLHEICLLNLTEADCRPLDEDAIRRFRAGGWRLQDAWVQECFQAMVSAHYEDHLDQLGIEMRETRLRHRVPVWKNLRIHKPWPPNRPIEMREHPREPSVKMEVD
ncbi:hypothetical protein WOLCODRAFT_93906 [Wolfiporia cocos MD-104 SS10]|uniref:Uncharacterized protein n=1 Tax=Wolfiporia cocos (strain MD-104) TaxID=742152 RepID=A0A2H3IVA1_WOLCO|nr:hypothetical protein WOLCODRAFT_93906 [Wolfiporia cocos MD-104 SS10]